MADSTRTITDCNIARLVTIREPDPAEGCNTVVVRFRVHEQPDSADGPPGLPVITRVDILERGNSGAVAQHATPSQLLAIADYLRSREAKLW